jgi:hypothetical protein
MIIKCNCKHAYQDATYGAGMRAHNPIVKEPKGNHWRCTVCNVEHSKGGDDPKKGKAK